MPDDPYRRALFAQRVRRALGALVSAALLVGIGVGSGTLALLLMECR